MNRRALLVRLRRREWLTSLRCALRRRMRRRRSWRSTRANRGRRFRGTLRGLSYESAQLANPEFFSAGNKELIALFRGLSPSGNLRLGGGSSEFTTYSDADPSGPPPFEVFGPDTSKTVKHGTVTTALALTQSARLSGCDGMELPVRAEPGPGDEGECGG